MFDGKSILVTGGTGSFGQAFVAVVLARFPTIRRLVVLSRDELKQFEMQQRFPRDRFPQVRFFLGDVRDVDRLRRAMEGVDIVIHAAALKQVPAAEYNPFECIKTNVLGAQNVIDACLDSNVTRVVALSTDKAAAPINLYGATKLCSDKLFVAANNMRGTRPIRLSVVRYGNVIGSRGSVIPLFQQCALQGLPLKVTDPRMTRFSITLTQGVDTVIRALELMEGGEIFVPKIPSYRIMDVAEAVAPGAEVEVIGMRPGEKLHEEMITPTDAPNTMEYQDHFVILPGPHRDSPKASQGGKPCVEGFSYASNTNTQWLDVPTLRSLIGAAA